MDLAWIFSAGTLTLATPCVLPLLPIYLAILTGGSAGDAEQKRGGLDVLGTNPNPVWTAPDADLGVAPSRRTSGTPSSSRLDLGASCSPIPVHYSRLAHLAGRLNLLISTAFFSVGFILVFTLLGLTATTQGSLITEYRTQLVLLGSLLIVLFGLKFLGLLRISWLERDRRLDDNKLKTRFGRLNALIMGFVFALGWTPCVGPVLGSVLTYTASNTTDPLTGAGYLAVYGAGMALPLLLLSLFADGARRVVRRLSPWLPRLEKATGLLLVVVGLTLMLGAGAPPPATATPAPGLAASSQSLEPGLGQPSARPRMVEFVSSSCSICRQMIPTVALIERDCGGRNVDVVKIDVTRPQNRNLAHSYGVRGVPTFVFLDERGKESARLVGFQQLSTLRQSLATLVGQKCDRVGLLPAEQSGSCASGLAAARSSSSSCSTVQ